VDRMFTSLDRLLASIALVTLTLGRRGRDNIMLVSVTERTRSRLRKAWGATRARILADFFVEGVLLAVLSGLRVGPGRLRPGLDGESTAPPRDVRRPSGERPRPPRRPSSPLGAIAVARPSGRPGAAASLTP